MSEKPHNSLRNKLLAIEYYNENNVTQAEVSKIFKISRQTFSVWLRDYNQNHSLDRKNREAVSYKIKQKHVNYAKKLLKKIKNIQ